MEQKRARFKVKANLISSSDYSRVKSARAILAENHEKNLSFFAAIKEAKVKEKELTTEKEILSRYSEVRIWQSWKPASQYVGVLMFMYKNNFKFK